MISFITKKQKQEEAAVRMTLTREISRLTEKNADLIEKSINHAKIIRELKKDIDKLACNEQKQTEKLRNAKKEQQLHKNIKTALEEEISGLKDILFRNELNKAQLAHLNATYEAENKKLKDIIRNNRSYIQHHFSKHLIERGDYAEYLLAKKRLERNSQKKEKQI